MSHPRSTLAAGACLILALMLTVAGCLSSPDDDPIAKAPRPKPASVYLSPAGSDGAKCRRGSPCQSLDRAYARAKPGQVVELAAGSYGDQRIEPRKGKSARKRVVFRPASGARVSIGELEIEAGVEGVEFQRLHFEDDWTVGPSDDGAPAAGIVFRGTTGPKFTILNARNVKVLGGSYGPSVDSPAQIKVYNPDNAYTPTDVLVSGVRFHDFTRTGDDVHTECLQVYAATRLTLRGNRFSNCDGTGALALTTVGESRVQDVLVENNWFDDAGDAFFAVQSDASVQGLVFRYNSALKALIFTGCEDACSRAEVTANVMPFNPSLCADGVEYSNNVFKGGTCGRSDTNVRRLDFVDADGFDLHISERSPARCRGDAKAIPSADIDGQRRSRARRPDAGADQLRTSRTPPRRCRL